MNDFVDVIWAGHTGYGELRFIRDGEVRQRWVRVPHTELEGEIVGLSEWDEDGWDVYYGVLPRTSKEGKGENVVDETSVLWADFDAKVYPGGAKAQAFYALGKVSPVPHIIVDSGHGYHAYWLMGNPVPFVWAARIMKGIAIATGADRVYDKARILRVPGTHNHKDPDPILVRVLRLDLLAPRYASEDFSDYTFRVDREEEQQERAQRLNRARRGVDTSKTDWGDLPRWLVGIIVTGRDEPKEGEPRVHDRSVLCFKVCARLIEAGWGDDEIATVFESYPEGIGEKMMEKGAGGARWLETTLRAAHQATGI